jgi:hypothetical protein
MESKTTINLIPKLLLETRAVSDQRSAVSNQLRAKSTDDNVGEINPPQSAKADR